MEDLAARIKALQVQLYHEAGGASVPPADINKYHDIALPTYKRELIQAIRNSNNPIHAIPL
jgi:hypothetical protein